MKVLFVGVNGIDMADPTSIIAMEFLRYYVRKKQDIHVSTFALGEGNSKKKIDCLIDSATTKFDGSKIKMLFFKVARKLRRTFGFNCDTILWPFCYLGLRKLYKSRDFDYLVAVAGHFDCAEAAYRFAKKTKTPYALVYFDSYSLSPFGQQCKSKLKREGRWLDYATKIFLDRDSAKTPFEGHSNKIEYFSTPIFPKEREYNPNGDIIFGGTFYSSFRPVSILNDFLSGVENTSETFAIYTPSKHEILKGPNIKSFDYIKKSEYNQICSKAKAIIVIGNGDHTTVIPSKLYDALAYRIPLICLNFGSRQREIEKLPLCFSGYDPLCIDKINQIRSEDLQSVDLSRTFSERNPEKLKAMFDGLFAEN